MYIFVASKVDYFQNELVMVSQSAWAYYGRSNLYHHHGATDVSVDDHILVYC